jgi:predicted Fe-S protein YdhL (DUF1289 family)
MTLRLPWTSDKPVESPCVNRCGLDPVSGLCVGCLRTMSEIAEWREMSSREKRRVLRALPQRRLQG